MIVQAIVFLAYCVASSAQDGTIKYSSARKINYDQQFKVKLFGNTKKVKLGWDGTGKGTDEVDIANLDGSIKVQSFEVNRKNQFIKEMHFKCGSEYGFRCGEDIQGVHALVTDSDILKKNKWWATNSPQSCQSNDDSDYCVKCGTTEFECPDYRETMNCSSAEWKGKCGATKSGYAKYKCKSIPALMNPRCLHAGCVGLNWKTSDVLLYDTPTCRISQAHFMMTLKLWKQFETTPDHIQTVIFRNGGHADTFLSINIWYSYCDNDGCNVKVGGKTLTGMYKPKPYFAFSEGPWSGSDKEDFSYKAARTPGRTEQTPQTVLKSSYGSATDSCWAMGADLPAFPTATLDGLRFYERCKQMAGSNCWLGLENRKIDKAQGGTRHELRWRDGTPLNQNELTSKISDYLNENVAVVDMENTDTEVGLRVKVVPKTSLNAIICQRRNAAKDFDVDDKCPVEVASARRSIQMMSSKTANPLLCRKYLLKYFGEHLVHSFMPSTKVAIFERYRLIDCDDFINVIQRRLAELLQRKCRKEVRDTDWSGSIGGGSSKRSAEVESLSYPEPSLAACMSTLRNKREINRDNEGCLDAGNNRVCCVTELVVDFHEVGGAFNYIIAPIVYKANQCAGQCSGLTKTKWVYTHIVENAYPNKKISCHPQDMGNLSIIYSPKDDDTSLRMSVVPGMQVKSCACG